MVSLLILAAWKEKKDHIAAIDFLRDEVKKAKPFTHGGLNQLPYMFFDAVAQAMENYLAACTTAKGRTDEEQLKGGGWL